MMIGPRLLAVSAGAYLLIGDHESVAKILVALASRPGEFISVAELELSPTFEDFRASPEYPEVLAAFEAAEAEAARIDAEAGL